MKRSNRTSLSSKMGAGCCADPVQSGSSYEAGKDLSMLKKVHAFIQEISLKAQGHFKLRESEINCYKVLKVKIQNRHTHVNNV